MQYSLNYKTYADFRQTIDNYCNTHFKQNRSKPMHAMVFDMFYQRSIFLTFLNISDLKKGHSVQSVLLKRLLTICQQIIDHLLNYT